MANSITEDFINSYNIKPANKIRKTENKIRKVYNFYTLDTKLIYKLIGLLEEKEINIDNIRAETFRLCIENKEKIGASVTEVLESCNIKCRKKENKNESSNRTRS